MDAMLSYLTSALAVVGFVVVLLIVLGVAEAVVEAAIYTIKEGSDDFE